MSRNLQEAFLVLSVCLQDPSQPETEEASVQHVQIKLVTGSVCVETMSRGEGSQPRGTDTRGRRKERDGEEEVQTKHLLAESSCA